VKNNKTKSEICIKCQECCKTVGVYSAHPYTPEIREFYEVRGAKVSQRTIFDETLTFIEFPFPCPNLDPIKGCLIYDTRPEVCKGYPEFDAPLLDSCELHKQGLI
jgi:Fe-S-cluster containining protein